MIAEEGVKSAGLSSGTFQESQPADRSASGLQFQKYQLDTTTTGVNGIARRAAPDYNVLFANRNMSGAQNGEGHARSTASFSSPEED